jgi:hypothetical protein
VGGLQIRRCQGPAVTDHGGTLGALALKPSGFCNIGVNILSIRYGFNFKDLKKINMRDAPVPLDENQLSLK